MLMMTLYENTVFKNVLNTLWTFFGKILVIYSLAINVMYLSTHLSCEMLDKNVQNIKFLKSS